MTQWQSICPAGPRPGFHPQHCTAEQLRHMMGLDEIIQEGAERKTRVVRPQRRAWGDAVPSGSERSWLRIRGWMSWIFFSHLLLIFFLWKGFKLSFSFVSVSPYSFFISSILVNLVNFIFPESSLSA